MKTQGFGYATYPLLTLMKRLQDCHIALFMEDVNRAEHYQAALKTSFFIHYGVALNQWPEIDLERALGTLYTRMFHVISQTKYKPNQLFCSPFYS